MGQNRPCDGNYAPHKIEWTVGRPLLRFEIAEAWGITRMKNNSIAVVLSAARGHYAPNPQG
jgi:hypothetical protein